MSSKVGTLKRRMIVLSDDEEEERQPSAPKKIPRRNTEVSDEEVFRVFYVLWVWTNRACPDTVTRRSRIVEETSFSSQMRYMPYPIATSLLQYLNDVDFAMFLERYCRSLSAVDLRDELRAMLNCVEGTSNLLKIVGVSTLVKKIREKPWYRRLNDWTTELESLHRQRIANPAATRERRLDWSLADQFVLSGTRAGAPVNSPVWRLVGERMPEGDTTMERREWNLGWGSKVFLRPENFIPLIRHGYLYDWNDVPIPIRTNPQVLAALVQRPPRTPFESMAALRVWFRTEEVTDDMIEMMRPFVRQD